MISMLLVAALAQAPQPLPIRTIEKSSQSYIDTARQVSARTPAEWSALWKLHAPGRPLPDVDFSRDMVVGVFLGSRNSAGYSVEIVSVDREAGGVVVRYKETAPGRSSVTAQVITSPYHLVAVPKVDGAVRFEKVD